jgi:hypothetical protein
MTLTDFVWVAVGETLLAGTFALGILVGISLLKRISHDNYDGKAQAGKDSGWYHAGNGSSSSCNGDGKGGSRKR